MLCSSGPDRSAHPPGLPGRHRLPVPVRGLRRGDHDRPLRLRQARAEPARSTEADARGRGSRLLHGLRPARGPVRDPEAGRGDPRGLRPGSHLLQDVHGLRQAGLDDRRLRHGQGHGPDRPPRRPGLHPRRDGPGHRLHPGQDAGREGRFRRTLPGDQPGRGRGGRHFPRRFHRPADALPGLHPSRLLRRGAGGHPLPAGARGAGFRGDLPAVPGPDLGAARRGAERWARSARPSRPRPTAWPFGKPPAGA